MFPLRFNVPSALKQWEFFNGSIFIFFNTTASQADKNGLPRLEQGISLNLNVNHNTLTNIVA